MIICSSKWVFHAIEFSYFLKLVLVTIWWRNRCLTFIGTFSYLFVLLHLPCCHFTIFIKNLTSSNRKMQNGELWFERALKNLSYLEEYDVSVQVRTEFATNFIATENRFPSKYLTNKLIKLLLFLSKSNLKWGLVSFSLSCDLENRYREVQCLKRWSGGAEVKFLIFDKKLHL